ncbi:hypothetical protein GJ496_005070 [Pomphorhynchus laevis]|nr:hypothetical protein GJ496_005985 [Pomphorhynchus laevis]KAI0980859.1 hypothetical protein GJ496_005070 [Pomphorhynchus laevis]
MGKSKDKSDDEKYKIMIELSKGDSQAILIETKSTKNTDHTSEDLEGVLFFIESSVFNSTITIRSNLHSYTIPTTDIQLNFGPVAPAEID